MEKTTIYGPKPNYMDVKETAWEYEWSIGQTSTAWSLQRPHPDQIGEHFEVRHYPYREWTNQDIIDDIKKRGYHTATTTPVFHHVFVDDRWVLRPQRSESESVEK